MNIRAVHEASGTFLHYEGTVVDVSEEIERSRTTADLITLINSEMRAPLLAISSALESLNREQVSSLPQADQSLVEVAARNATHVLQYLHILQPDDSETLKDENTEVPS